MGVSTFNLTDSSVALLGSYSLNVVYGFAQNGQQIRFVANGKKCRVNLTTLGGADTQPWNITVDGTPISDITIDNSQTFRTIFDLGSDGVHLVVMTRQNATGQSYFTAANGIEVTADGTASLSSGVGGRQIHNVNPTNDSYLVGEERASENAGSGYAFLRYMDESRVFKSTTTSIELFCSYLSSGTSIVELLCDGVLISRISTSVTGNDQFAQHWMGLDGSREHTYTLTVQSAVGGFGPVVYQILVDSMNTASFGTTRDIVLCIGDSNTFSDGALGNTYQGFPSLTGHAVNKAIANRGVSGIKVAGQTPNIVSYLSALVKTPVQVIVLLGTNDWSLSPTTLTQFKTDCVSFLTTLLGAVATIPISILKIHHSNSDVNDALIDTYNAKWVEAVAQVADSRVTLYDTPSWLVRADYQDSQHMGPTGHVKVAANLTSIILPSISGGLSGMSGMSAINEEN